MWYHENIQKYLGFKTSTNSQTCFETLKAVVKPVRSTAEIFSKSWTSLLFSCTSTIVQGMEERNVQQHLNILPPKAKNQTLS